MTLVAQSKKSRKRRARIITLVVILSVVLVGLSTLLISLGFYIDSLDTILPNVWAEGIDMSGLTLEEARQALLDGGYEERAAGIAVTVTFPYDTEFTVSGDDVGMTLNAAEAAQAAYEFGRDKSFFGNAGTYIRALFSKTELNELSLPNYDTAIIRTLADEYAQLFNESLFDNNMEISDKQITITKGSAYYPATSEEVYNFTELAMQRAIEQNAHLEAKFIPEINPDDSFDLKAIHDYIYEEPVSSVYDPDLGNPKSVNYDPVNMGATESKTGRTFDLQPAQVMLDNAGNGDIVIIPIVILEPELSQAELRGMLYRDVLGERQAGQGSSAERAGNIRLASAAIDGTVLQPGEQFSFNAVVGQRTEAKGYREANAIINGEFVPELGGGICQVSSAIYAALLYTDLEIVERRPHGLTVNYLPKGQDATVSWGSIDFKFKNNTDYPIKLEVTTSGAVTVTVKIHGTRINEVYYELKSVEHEDSPIEMTTIERAFTPEDGVELDPGERHTLVVGNAGSLWEVWRYHYSDPDLENPILDGSGNHVKTLYNTTRYPMRAKVIIYNPADPTPRPERPTERPTEAPTNPPTEPPTDPPPE